MLVVCSAEIIAMLSPFTVVLLLFVSQRRSSSSSSHWRWWRRRREGSRRRSPGKSKISLVGHAVVSCLSMVHCASAVSDHHKPRGSHSRLRNFKGPFPGLVKVWKNGLSQSWSVKMFIFLWIKKMFFFFKGQILMWERKKKTKVDVRSGNKQVGNHQMLISSRQYFQIASIARFLWCMCMHNYLPVSILGGCFRLHRGHILGWTFFDLVWKGVWNFVTRGLGEPWNLNSAGDDPQKNPFVEIWCCLMLMCWIWFLSYYLV